MAKKSVLLRVCVAMICRSLDITCFEAPNTDVAYTSVRDRVTGRTILAVVVSVWNQSEILEGPEANEIHICSIYGWRRTDDSVRHVIFLVSDHMCCCITRATHL